MFAYLHIDIYICVCVCDLSENIPFLPRYVLAADFSAEFLIPIVSPQNYRLILL